MGSSTGSLHKPARRGFTLIELLSVVAILAIIAAILFPVLAQTREKGRQSACASNTRQLALVILMYAESYDDTLSPVAYGQEEEGEAREAGEENIVLWTILVEPYLRNSRVRLCPSDVWARRNSYGLNELAFADLADPDELRAPVRTLAAFQRASETVMLGELGTADDFKTPRSDTYKLVAPSFPLNDDDDARPAARHHERVNLSFMDAHQKSMRLEQLYLNQTPADRWFLP
jgi:prepilin-type N-terminal cleavage/methylation domain-containing protein